jgi:hypothetical protein
MVGMQEGVPNLEGSFCPYLWCLGSVVHNIGREWVASMSEIVEIKREQCYGQGECECDVTNGDASATQR